MGRGTIRALAVAVAAVGQFGFDDGTVLEGTFLRPCQARG